MKFYLFALLIVFSCEKYDEEAPTVEQEETEELDEENQEETEISLDEVPDSEEQPVVTDPVEDDEPEEKPEEFSINSMLRNLNFNIVLGNLDLFADESRKLKKETSGYCQSPNLNNLKHAQDQWLSAMFAWQKLEMMKLKPFIDPELLLGDSIYSFENRHPPFRVFQTANSLSTDSNNSFEELDFPLKGLNAVQTILFYAEEKVESCRRLVRLPRNYAELSEEDKIKVNCNYLDKLTSDLINKADTLKSYWHDSDHSYAEKLSNSGQNGAQQFSDALFYLDKEVKDEKIGVPSGIAEGCRGDSCPCQSEMLISRSSLIQVKANLTGFYEVLSGDFPNKSGFGFSEYLVSVGKGEVSESIGDLVTKTIKKIDSMEGTSLFDMAVSLKGNPCSENSSQDLCELHEDIKKITDLLKGEFLQALDLKAPARAQGDND